MTHKLCDECETVAHCSEHGCIPKLLANPHQEPVAWLTRDPYDGLWYATNNKVSDDDRPLYLRKK